MTTVSGEAGESVHVQLMQWAKQNPEMASMCGFMVAIEFSPIGPTRMMWKAFQDMRAKKAAEEAKWQRIEITVPPQSVSYTHLTLPTTPYV